MRTPTCLRRRRSTALAQRFVTSQRYHPAARIFIVDVAGGEPVTNEPDVLGEVEHEQGEKGNESQTATGRGVVTAPVGLSAADVADTGRLRVLTEPITNQGKLRRDAAGRRSAAQASRTPRTACCGPSRWSGRSRCCSQSARGCGSRP